MGQNERRRHFRNAFDRHVEVELDCKDNIPVELASTGREMPLLGTILDLSLGGMLVRLADADLRLPEGESFVVTFSLPDNGDQMVLEGVVVRQSLIEGRPCHGFRLSCGEKQEKILWKFLTEEQRKQKQLHFENVRMERQQLTRLRNSLQELLVVHAAVGRAKSRGMSYLVTVLAGLVGCGLMVLALNAVNRGVWDTLVDKHDVAAYRAGPPDYDALVPAETVQIPPFATPEAIAELRQRAEEKRDKEIRQQEELYQRRMKPVFDEYDRLKTSAPLIGTFAVMVGIILSAALAIFFQHRRPRLIARAREHLENKTREFAGKYPEEVQSSGGLSALDDPATLEDMIRSVSEKLLQPADRLVS